MTGSKDDASNRKLIDRLVAKSHHGPRLGLLGTTYELAPEFFETDFLPTLLELGAWDDRSWSSRIAVEKALADLEAAVILTDAHCYRGRPHSLRVDIQPVDVGPGAKLHAKVLLVLHDQAVRLIVGSANLTENGYRKNREVAAVIDVTYKEPSASNLISDAIRGFETVLGSWVNDSAGHILSSTQERLDSWSSGNSGDEQEWFVWSGGDVQLWREYLKRWPSDEIIERITIVSPFWSAEESAGPISLFMKAVSDAGAMPSSGMELRLLTEARAGVDGVYVPSFGAGIPHVPGEIKGLRATAHAVDPSVSPDEIQMEGFAATRALHAKVVLLEGKNTALAYMGSANFSRHGWGFGRGIANIEAGIVVRRAGKQRQMLAKLLPATIGKPVPLTGEWQGKVIVEQSSVEVPQWPTFIRSIRLTQNVDMADRLDLQVEIDKEKVAGSWTLNFSGETKPDDIPLMTGEQSCDEICCIQLQPEALERILREKELLVCWWAWQKGREVPVNVAFDARDALPISPGSGRPGEALLIGYYQGRISFEEMFPPPIGEDSGNDQTDTFVDVSAVDTSRIQSYQIREFVEALPGIVADLSAARISSATIRLALLGPVSPLALAREVSRAVDERRRTPVAAGFQIVEILGCLFQALKLEVPDKHALLWKEYVQKAISEVEAILSKMKTVFPDDLSKGTSFAKYEKTLRRACGKVEHFA